ncbi:MAG: lantibiotic biosynthesis protein [Mucilaginibacter sp.]|nr:lantibiotic biosynthesis protein [Mucilaginibacter sp.]
MLNLAFKGQIFVRVAGRTFSNFNYNDLHHQIKDKAFQAAIFFASGSLFADLKKNEFSYDGLSEKSKFSLKKYYNRYCFRATPFGLFSSSGMVNWGNNGPFPSVAGDQELTILPDFELTADFGRRLSKITTTKTRYFANHSIYKAGDTYRYIARDANKQSDFKIYSFNANAFINKLFKFCLRGKSVNELIEFCATQGEGVEESAMFIDNLIESGILFSGADPHYMGEHYFNKINQLKDCEDHSDKMIANWNETKKFFLKKYTVADLPLNTVSNLDEPFDFNFAKGSFYVNSGVKFHGEISGKFQQEIMEGIEALDKLTPNKPHPALQKFKENFRNRFESQEVPLLRALDPELGVNYMNLERQDAEKIILDDLTFKSSTKNDSIEWSPVHRLLLNKIHSTGRHKQVVLTGDDFKGLEQETASVFPPSFSVMFSVANNLIDLKQIGGCSAAAVPARFTLFSDEIKNHVSEIVHIEQDVNDQVLFAEVSCAIPGHVANINTKNITYNYEIPLLVTSELPPDNQIFSNDLTISIVADQIVLRSKRLNKIIIPRLSSAYNYTNHHLTLFRFLCDLQYQSIKTDFNLRLDNLFPGLDFYPTVIYKSCILHKATWVVKDDVLKALDNENAADECRNLLSRLSIPQYFTITDGDNSLMFDSSQDESINLFIKCIKGRQEVTLKEALIDKDSPTRDSNNNPLVTEMLAAVINKNAVYNNLQLPINLKSWNIKRAYIPGDEWLYFKCYCTPNVADEIIGNELYKLIQILNKKQILKQWHFVRYKDPEPHLRLRFKTGKTNLPAVIELFNRLLKKKHHTGSISAIQADTYNREIERYGVDTMDIVEKIFDASSNYALQFFCLNNKDQIDFSAFEAMIVSMDAIISQYDDCLPAKEQFAETVAFQLGVEFGFNKALKRQLDNKYRATHQVISACMMPERKEYILSVLGYKNLRNHLNDLNHFFMSPQAEIRKKLFADIIHMHVNRLSSEESRKQEFVIYYLLKKYYLSCKMNKNT